MTSGHCDLITDKQLCLCEETALQCSSRGYFTLYDDDDDDNEDDDDNDDNNKAILIKRAILRRGIAK